MDMGRTQSHSLSQKNSTVKGNFLKSQTRNKAIFDISNKTGK